MAKPYDKFILGVRSYANMKSMLAGLALTSLIATEAAAVTLSFDVAADNGARFTFLLPENPVPDLAFEIRAPSGLGGFALRNINAVNSIGERQVVTMEFGNSPVYTRLAIVDASGSRFLFFGNITGQDNAPILFTGTFSDPTFKRGTFQFTAVEGSRFETQRNAGTVQISAVPEPVTWLSMIGGFFIAGAALRYRRRTSYTLAFAAPPITT
jgi:hypothetical protein